MEKSTVEQMLKEIKDEIDRYYFNDAITCEVCVDLQQEVDEIAIKYLDKES